MVTGVGHPLGKPAGLYGPRTYRWTKSRANSRPYIPRRLRQGMVAPTRSLRMDSGVGGKWFAVVDPQAVE
jgi:hypothetical protein